MTLEYKCELSSFIVTLRRGGGKVKGNVAAHQDYIIQDVSAVEASPSADEGLRGQNVVN